MRRYILAIVLLLVSNYCYSIAYKVVYLNSFGYLGADYRYVPLAVLVFSSLVGFLHYWHITRVNSIQLKLFLSIFYLFSVVSVPITSWMISDWDIFKWLKINILYFLLVSIFIFFTRIKLPAFVSNRYFAKIALQGYPVLIGLLLVILIYPLGINLDLNFSTIYDRRLIARDSTPLIFKYIISNTIAVVLPISAYLALKEKRLDIGLLTLFLILYIFSYEGSKAVFFKPIAVLFIVYFCRIISVHKILDIFLQFYASLTIILSLLIYGIKNDFFNLILHRSFFLPNKLIVWYLETYDRGNDIGDAKSPAYYIGTEYLGSPDINANSNFIVSGLLNNGFITTCCITVVASFFVANLLRGRAGTLGLVVAVLLSLTLAESAFLTSLGNHGLILLIVYSEIFKTRYNETMH